MKKLFYLVSIFLCAISINTTCYSQRKLTVIDINNTCSYDGCRKIITQFYSYDGSKRTKEIINQILTKAGAHTRIDFRAGDIGDNVAQATINSNYEKVVYYSEQKVADMFGNTINWAYVFALSHEIGHHINGHFLNKMEKRQIDELDADEFAGFILNKLGATLMETKNCLNDVSEQGCKTSPPRALRKTSAMNGWQRAKNETPLTSGAEFNISDNLSIEIEQGSIGYTPQWNFINNAIPINFSVENYVVGGNNNQTVNVQLASYDGKAVIWFNPFVTCDCIADLKINSVAFVTEKPQTFQLTNFRKFPRESNGVAGGPCMGLNNLYFRGGWDGNIELSVDKAGNIKASLTFVSYRAGDRFAPQGPSYKYTAPNIFVPIQFKK